MLDGKVLGPIMKRAEREAAFRKYEKRRLMIHGFTCHCGEFKGLIKRDTQSILRFECDACGKRYALIDED